MNVYQFIQGWRSLWIGKVIIPLHLFHSPFLLTLRISENHRIFEVGTDLWSPFGATSPAQGQPPRASCPERFWISLGMKTPQLLWEACTSAQSLSQEKFSEGHSCVARCAHCLWLCHWTQLKSLVLSSPLSAEVLLHINKIPLFLLLPRLKGPCSLSLSSHMRCWRPLITFDALFWTMSMCVSHWGAQTWTLHPREGPHRITSPKLLAALCLMQPRMASRTHCWLMVNEVSNSRAFSARLLLTRMAASISCCLRLFHPRWRTWHFLLLNFMRLYPGTENNLIYYFAYDWKLLF